MKRLLIFLTTIILMFSMSAMTVWADEPDPSADPEPEAPAVVISDMTAQSAGVKKIQLSWTGSEEGLVYQVYRAKSVEGAFEPLDETTETTYIDKGLSPAKTYYYCIVCGDAASETVSAVPFPAVDLSGKRSGDGTKLSWTKSDYATGYQLFRRYSEEESWKRIKTVSASKSSSKDSYALSGKASYYRIRPIYKKNKNAKAVRGQFSQEIKRGAIYRVFIETGHGIDSQGRWDPGATWNGYQEAKLMIPIAQSMTNYLRQSHVYVYTDAFDGNNINLLAAIKKAKTKKLSAMVHIHCDAYMKPSGTLPLYRTKAQKKLAKKLNTGVHSTIDIPNRGLEYRDDLISLKRNCGTVACLFETGSIKNDNKLLRKKYDAYGKGLAKGMCNYLGIDFVE